MRLFSGKIPALSEEIVKALVENGEVETAQKREVVQDVASVFDGYVAAERAAVDTAKDMLERQGRPQSDFGRLKALAAEQKGIKVGEEMLDYLLDQLVQMLMHSANVDEVFAEDHTLRRRMRPVLRKHLEVDAVLEQEVRGQLKHVTEGTRTWEIEYQRVMGDIQRRRGLR